MKKDCTLKYVKGVSSVTQLSCVQPVINVPLAVLNLPVGARLQTFWQTWLEMGVGPRIVQILREGYTLPFRIWPNHKVSHGHKLLCQSSQEQLPDGGITSAYRQKCGRTGSQPDLPFFQPAVFGTQTQQQVETHTGPKQTESVPQGGEIQNGDTRNHQNIPPARGVGHLDRFQGCLLPHSNAGTIQEISKISCPGPDIPIQGPPFRSVHSAFEVHCNSKGGENDGHTQGYKNPPATSHQDCLQHTRTLVKMCQDLGWLVNVEKSELEPKQVFDFVGYQFDLRSGRVQPTLDRWQSLQEKIQRLLVLPACPVR